MVMDPENTALREQCCSHFPDVINFHQAEKLVGYMVSTSSVTHCKALKTRSVEVTQL